MKAMRLKCLVKAFGSMALSLCCSLLILTPPYYWYWTVTGGVLVALNFWAIFRAYQRELRHAELVAVALRGLRDPWSDGRRKGLLAAEEALRG